MKKFMTFALALCMLLSVGATGAFAATQTNLDSASKAVQAKYEAVNRPESYSVDITWGDMQFDYKADEAWNNSTHKWEKTSAVWQANAASNTVTVANNSSTAIDATFSFANSATYNDVSGTFSGTTNFANNKLSLPVPEENKTATSYSVSFMPSGSIPNSLENYTVIGTITIDLTAVSA